MYLGVDVGSVSTDIVLLDKNLKFYDGIYLRTKGRPINAVQEGFKILKNKYGDIDICGAGTTGSGRRIAAFLIGADTIKNEITAHATASLSLEPDLKTIIEIGGQDSKIIILRNGVVNDFAMNTVCAAGTGSFLDRQAERLGIPIEEFGSFAVKSENPVRIAGRCAVFAESDMIHKQQLGFSDKDIIGGLCDALVRNYLSNVAKGKEIKPKIFFQGGVAANIGMKASFEKALGQEIYVPKHYDMMGAIGAAILASEQVQETCSSKFKGFNIADINYTSISFECTGCSNRCEVIKICNSDSIIGCFGDRCGKWSSKKAV